MLTASKLIASLPYDETDLLEFARHNLIVGPEEDLMKWRSIDIPRNRAEYMNLVRQIEHFVNGKEKR